MVDRQAPTLHQVYQERQVTGYRGSALGVAAPLLALPVQARASRRLADRDGRVAGLLRKALGGMPASARRVFVDIVLSWTAWGIKLAALAVVFAQLADLRVLDAVMGAIGGDLSTVLPVHAPGGFGTYEAGVVALVEHRGCLLFTTEGFADAAAANGVPITYIVRPEGSHTWGLFESEMQESWNTTIGPALGV